MDAIDRLEAMSKAKGHKYKSRKKVGGKYVYDYGTKKKTAPAGQTGFDFGVPKEKEQKFESKNYDHQVPKSPGVDALKDTQAAKEYANSMARTFTAMSAASVKDKAAQRTVGGVLHGAMRTAGHDLAASGHSYLVSKIKKEMHDKSPPRGSAGLHGQLVSQHVKNLNSGMDEGKKAARKAGLPTSEKAPKKTFADHFGSESAANAGRTLAASDAKAIADSLTNAMSTDRSGPAPKYGMAAVFHAGGEQALRRKLQEIKHPRRLSRAQVDAIMREAKKNVTKSMDAIDTLEALTKSDDDEAYMLGYKDAQAGKPAKPKEVAAKVEPFDDEAGEPNGEGEEAEEAEGAAQAAAEDELGDEQPDAIDALAEQTDDAQEAESEGTDLDGDGDADMPGEDVDGDGEVAAEELQAQPEGEEGAAPMEGDEAPLPQDDGDNHGVGDLDEDGQSQSLIQEITNLEKLYYAAKGLHGSGHFKAEKALDLYHRAVRKLVRAQMGAGQEEAPQAGAEGVQPGGKTPEDQGREMKGGGKPPPFGKKAEGASDDGPEDTDDEGDEGDDADDAGGTDEDKKKKLFGKSTSIALDPLDVLLLETGEPAEIRPLLVRLAKAGEAVSRKIRKLKDEGKPQDQAVAIALDMKRRGDIGKMSAVPEYLIGFMRHEVAKACEGGKKPDSGKLANLMVAKMVDRFSWDGRLQEAAQSYSITSELIHPIIERMLGVTQREDHSSPSESAQHSAMGCERMAYSMTGADLSVGDNALVKGAEGLQVLDRGPKQVPLVDDTVDPSATFQKGQVARMRHLYGNGPNGGGAPVRVTVSADCPFHGGGGEAIYKSHAINHGYLRCTCPTG